MNIVGLARAGRLVAVVGLVVAAGAGLAACGSDAEGKSTEETFVGADKVCGGLFDASLAKKVEAVTTDSEFFYQSDEGLKAVVEALTDGYESGRSWATGKALCELSPKGGGAGDGAAIKFSMYAPQDVKDLRTDPGTVSYTMGKRSEARATGASLYLECVSPRLKGSETKPLRVYGSFSVGESDAPDTPETRDANLEILHTGALSVVKELGCENNAGLPETPDLTPK
ncbi:hypothetical protein OG893_13505 [Streptomyces sp. NBC_01696]|uniref:hypothetical protein n=1 Tax=unclassified Streptomyces TaxID=2593676 RepID=UPI002E3724E9|nr:MULTISPECIES: hypothetical protein [unclassified Streptomyces]